MDGEAPDRPPLSPAAADAPHALARRLELAKLAVGVPALLVCLFASLLAFRLARRPLGDPLLWLTVLGVLAVFAAYFGYSLYRLRRLRHPAPESEPAPTSDGRDSSPAERGHQQSEGHAAPDQNRT